MKSRRGEGLDATDWRIIEMLQADGRLPIAALAKRIGLSQPAASERVKRLESRGVIEGYAARINFQAVGLDILAIVRVRTTFEKLQDCLRLFASMPEILEVYGVRGP